MEVVLEWAKAQPLTLMVIIVIYMALSIIEPRGLAIALFIFSVAMLLANLGVG